MQRAQLSTTAVPAVDDKAASQPAVPVCAIPNAGTKGASTRSAVRLLDDWRLPARPALPPTAHRGSAESAPGLGDRLTHHTSAGTAWAAQSVVSRATSQPAHSRTVKLISTDYPLQTTDYKVLTTYFSLKFCQQTGCTTAV
jgi:hypothetical protein